MVNYNMVKESWPRTGFDVETKIPFRYFNEKDIKKYSDELKRTGTNIEEFLKKHDISNKEKAASLYYENYRKAFEKIALWKDIIHNAGQWANSALRYSPVYRSVRTIIKNPTFVRENAGMVLREGKAGVTRDMAGNVVDAISPIPGLGTAIANASEFASGIGAGFRQVKNIRAASKATKSLENIEDPVARANFYRSQNQAVQNKIKVANNGLQDYWYQQGFDKVAVGYLGRLTGKRSLADKLFMKKQNFLERVLNKPKEISIGKTVGIGTGSIGGSLLALRNFIKKEPLVKKTFKNKSLKDFVENDDINGFYEQIQKGNGFTQEDVDYVMNYVKRRDKKFK